MSEGDVLADRDGMTWWGDEFVVPANQPPKYHATDLPHLTWYIETIPTGPFLDALKLGDSEEVGDE